MKAILLMVLGFVLVFGCAGSAPKAQTDELEQAQPPPAAQAPPPPPPPPQAAEPQDNATVEEGPIVIPPPPPDNRPEQRFTVTAKDYAFTPSTITVNKGSRVFISVTAVDRKYGFAILDYNVNQLVDINQTVEVSFVADKAGTFEIKNTHITSGAARGMTGTLVVQ